MAALVHRVPGKWVGHAVLSNTFRHPAVLAKAATVMDHATGGRFIVGLGAGWHEGEHLPFGIPMPPMPERFDRFESAVHVLRALWSDAAAAPPGVTRPDPFYPLAEATNEPPPLTPGGPPLWLGGQKRRGIALAAAVADGWALPAVVALGSAVGPRRTSARSATRSSPRSRRSAATRSTFEISAQIPTGTTAEDRRWALGQAREAVERGATHVILGMPARLGAGRRRRRRPRGRRAAPRGPRRDGPRRARRSGPSPPTPTWSGSSRSSTPVPRRTRRRSTRSAGATRTYPGSARFLAELDGRAVGAATVGRIYVYPPDYPALWASIGVLPEARRPGIGERLLARRLGGRAAARQDRSCYIRCVEDRPEGIDFLAHRGFAEFERSKTVRLELAGLAGPGRRATARHRVDDARRATRPRRRASTPSRSRPSPTSRAATSRWPPATSRSSGPATSTAPSIPKDAFFVAVDDGERPRRRLRQPADAAGLDDRRLARHDRGPPRLARPGHRPRAQARDDRLGDRPRPHRARDRQRRGERPDAGGERPARLPAPAGRAHDARSAVRRHHDAGDRDRPTETEPVADADAASDPAARPGGVRLAARRPGPREGPPGARTSPAATIPTRPPASPRTATTAGCCVAMAVAIVASGFVIGTVIALLGPAGGR